MTTTRKTTAPANATPARNTTALTAILRGHGFDALNPIKQAAMENVAFACLDCQSIAAVTPTATSTREQQRDLINYECCGEVVKF